MKGRWFWWLLAAAVFATAMAQPRSAVDTPTMVKRLVDLDEKANLQQNFYLNDRRIPLTQKFAEQATTPRERLEWGLRFAKELLRAGRSEAAIGAFVELREACEALPRKQKNRQLKRIQKELVRAHLRLGEQDNCVAHHGVDSCLLPFQGRGIHENPRGSAAALEELLRVFKDHPDDLEARWLANFAAMTLGKHPQSIPEPWRISPAVFLGAEEFPRFLDVAGQTPLAHLSLAGGVALDDFTGDGRLDVFTSSYGLRDPLRLLVREPSGEYIDRSENAGLTRLTGGLNLNHADVDNDGDVDVYVLRGAWLAGEGLHPNSLLRNDGHGRFTEVTEEAGLLHFAPTQAAVWADFDLDGWLDLFVAYESTPKRPFPARLYHNQGDGTFAEVGEVAGVALSAFVKAVTAGDYDNDGRTDLYLSVFGGPNQLLRNTRSSEDAGDSSFSCRFEEVAGAAGVTEPTWSFPTWFFDYDNDGWQDLFVAGYIDRPQRVVAEIAALYLGQEVSSDTPRLYRNNGDGTFTDATQAAGLDRVILAMAANYGDLDNDGFLDLYIGTGHPDLGALLPNRMFRNVAGQHFEDVTTAGGFGHVQKGHGIAFADLDHDGDQDLYAVLGGFYSGDTYANVLFENPGFENRWLTVQFQGKTSNRSAIGCRLKVTIQEPAGQRHIHLTAGTGGSFGSSSLQQEIGLGSATKVEELRIFWPASGQTQEFQNLPLDQTLRIVEGDDSWSVMSPP